MAIELNGKSSETVLCLATIKHEEVVVTMVAPVVVAEQLKTHCHCYFIFKIVKIKCFSRRRYDTI